MKKICLFILMFVWSSTLLAQNTFYYNANKTYSERLRSRAEAGDPHAMNNMGSCLDRGDGIAQDHTKAFEWFKKAAETGDILAQFNLGGYYYTGIATDQNYTEALYWYEKSAKQNFPPAQYYLGYMYYKGDGVQEKDYTKALYWYEKSAKQNFPHAQYALGNMYSEGKGTNVDYENAIYWHEQAANQNYPASMDAIASCYILKKDYVHAVQWLQKAYDRDYLTVCHNLADMYYYGNGVEQSYEKAFTIFSKGSLHDQHCKYRMAVMLRYGLGTEKDNVKANALLLEAADNGIARAQYQLGIDCYVGSHHEQNYKMAVTYLEKALEDKYMLNDAKGDICRKLSACYRFGRGVEVNEAKANEYMKLAAGLGDSDARKIQKWLNIQ